MDSVNSLASGKEHSISVQSYEEDGMGKNYSGPKGPIFLSSIGAHELFSPEMWKAGLTELVATAFLVFTLTTSIIACLDSHEVDPKLLVPFAVFSIVFLFLMVTVPLSGGHMSPVLTFIAALIGDVTLVRALVYVAAQCIGSIIGFLIIKTAMDHREADTYSLGGCIIRGTDEETSGLSSQIALLLEFCWTFVVLFVGVTVAFDKKRCKELGLAMVCAVVAGSMALAVFVSITVTGQAGYAGVGLNPARCLGPALLIGGPLWYGHWVFWMGPFLACLFYYGLSLNLPKVVLVSADGEV
ncbi:Major intrinsic protein [Quillaja saponaria]|uniref:Major intrinsic protein n=1 Tax=Quillaja saponaria TaxID=32244 RepID=A0AAD7M191_QUISA|nr:Major intrinsic protein [Quillaja saponaria]